VRRCVAHLTERRKASRHHLHRPKRNSLQLNQEIEMNKFNSVFEGVVYFMAIAVVMGGTFAMFAERSVLFA